MEDYEKEKFKFEHSGSVGAILFRMEEQGVRQKDLAPILGGKSRVSEILSHKSPLTLAMARALSERLHIPAELLPREPAPAQYGEEAGEEAIPLPLLVKSGLLDDEEATRPTARAVVQRYLTPRGPLYLRRTIRLPTARRRIPTRPGYAFGSGESGNSQ